MNIKSKFSNNSFKAGSYSIFSSVFVIAIAVVAVMIIKALPASITKFDLSEQQLYTLSEQTKMIASQLEDDVDIYLLTQSGSEDSVVQELLEKYRGLSSKIHVAVKDVVQNPGFIKQYDDSIASSLYANSLLITCKDKHTFVNYSDMFRQEYDMENGGYTYTFAGESEITGAIYYVTNEDLPKVYVLDGHGETELASSFTEAIKKQNIDIENLNLMSMQQIPEDCKCLLIIGPTKDISEAESKVIAEYLQNGGRMFIATGYVEKSTSNLYSLVEQYGVYADEGVIFEQDRSHYISGQNWFLLPNLLQHDITNPLIEHGYYPLFPECHAINYTEDFEYDENLSVVPLIQTSESAYLKKSFETSEKEDGDTEGQFTLGVAISQLINGSENETRVVWISTPLFLYEDIDAAVAGTNQDLFINSIAWLCEMDNSISIHAKNISSEYLSMSEATASLWTFVMVVAVPLSLIICGIIVVIKRRHK